MGPISTAGSIATIFDIFSKLLKGQKGSNAVAFQQEILILQQHVLLLQTHVNEAEAKINQCEARSLLFKKENMDLVQENGKLILEISKRSDWDKEREKYELYTLESGSTVYHLKGTDQKFCPRCIVENNIAIHLQPSVSKSSKRFIYCPKCNAEFVIKHFESKSIEIKGQ